MDLWRSLIYDRKNKGPNTEPYGTYGVHTIHDSVLAAISQIQSKEIVSKSPNTIPSQFIQLYFMIYRIERLLEVNEYT